jgi:hypothetical protein|nr:MAG TPA: Protein of unknown function (DUF2442) [Bacteriophage sp.]
MLKVDKIWITPTAVHILTADGRTAHENFDDYPRLRWATPEQRANYETSSFGIHWPDVDEDLNFEAFFRDRQAQTPLYKLFMEHPELNASAVACRLGIRQSLLAQYISGTKKPSEERSRKILNAIHDIGKELIAVSL